MPDYQDAIDALKKQMEENVKERTKSKTKWSYQTRY